MFSLPGRGFHQRVTLISSVPMTLDDVIVHVRQFIIALVSVDGCSSFSDPDGFLDVPDSSVGFLVYNVHSFPVYDVVLDKEPNRRIRHIKEAIWIRKTRTPINRDEGNYELPHVYEEVKKSMRQDKRKWVDHLAMEAEEPAHNGRMKEVYDITKTLSNDKHKTTNAVKDKGGNLITEGLARRKRWKEHFEEILNRPIPDDPVTDVEIDPIINEISTDPITKAEIRTALRKMKNGKAGGKDEITAELLKADMNTTEKWLVKLFRTFWEQEKVPKTWKQGLIVKIPKKGDLTECGNWRGITLTSVPSKVFGRVLIDRIRDGVNSKLRDEQAGFRSGRGTVEQIFILRNIIEQVVEWQATLYITFVDFEKAFDSVHRESLWKIMESYGIPCKIIHMVQMLYEDSECAVLDEGEESEWFKVKTGVKQGDVMSGFIFLIVVDWTMRNTTAGNKTGIRWNFTSKLEDLDLPTT